MTMWMNEYEVDDVIREFADDPVLGPASMTLSNMRDWVNRNSDGWPYWRAAQKAGEKLMTLLHDARLREVRYDLDSSAVTEADYKAALRPVKSFRTRQAATFRIVEVGDSLDPHEHLRAVLTVAYAALNVADGHLTNDDEDAARAAMTAARDVLSTEVTA